MAILVNAHQLTKSFTDRPLFQGLSFSIESGERIGLIGPNGAGKSTLLRILSSEIPIDGGILSIQRGLRVGFLAQVPQFSTEATVESTIMEASHDPYDWKEISRAHEIMSKLSLSGESTVQPDTMISKLSGGWKKRVALARELLRQPDLLLLDEPTNHLDVESILWLEELLANAKYATITITHDRLFLQRISNRIFELDRRHPNGLLRIAGDYAKYLEVRESLLEAQEKHETKLKNTLRRETEWLRRGAKARATKQQARINQAAVLAQDVAELTYRNQNRKVQIDFLASEKNPKKLIEAKKISKVYNGNKIIPEIDLLITPKTRLGLIGSNGCGKSTLIRLLMGSEKPDTGSVFHAEKLEVSYFEQNRESLDPGVSVFKTICPSGDMVHFGDSQVHAKSYLSRFLFTFEQMDMAVGKLSGGEQSRLLIARLMLRKANVLILDEPTNDLDMSTLDVLQSVLADFSGAIILVTHDRYFLDQVSNHLLAFGIDENGNKQLTSLVGLDQWEEWHEEQNILQENQKKKSAKTAATEIVESKKTIKKKKLSFKEQHDLDTMEERIQKAESLMEKLIAETADSKNANRIADISRQMAETQAEIDRLYARWSELTRE